MYSQKWNLYFQNKIKCSVSQFLHSWICYRFKYFLDRSAYSAARKYVDRSWEYINRSRTHEWGNWDWGHAIPRKGIYINGIFLSVWALDNTLCYATPHSAAPHFIFNYFCKFVEIFPKVSLYPMWMTLGNNLLVAGVIDTAPVTKCVHHKINMRKNGE
jgi:hypothetical protein